MRADSVAHFICGDIPLRGTARSRSEAATRPELLWARTMVPAEVADEVAGVVVADMRHHLADSERRALQECARAIHSQRLEMAHRRDTYLLPKQM